MKNVSNEFISASSERTDYYVLASVKFADGTEKELSRSDFYLSGNSYTDAAGSSSFPLGVALEKQMGISIVNDVDQWSTYDFYGAEFTMYCCLDLDSGKTEKILLGTFTVIEPESYGSIIEVTAADAMYLGDTAYTTLLSFPMTAAAALRDSCSTCGVTLQTTTFTNGDYVISSFPDGITHRTLWGLCAMLAGGNARMDEYNRLNIISYDFSFFDKGDLDGGIFDGATPYASGDTADGGSFNPWDTGYVYDAGTFSDMKDYHVFFRAKNLTVATDDVVITGIQATVDDVTYLYGEEGYILTLTNQLIEGNPQDAMNRIGPLIVGVRFRPFEMDHIAYPMAEFGDVCYVIDRKQNIYQSVITDVNFTFFGYTTLKCSADSPMRNSSNYYSKTTEAAVKARLNTKKQLAEYDRAVQMLTSLITQSFGVFKTEEVLGDGSTVFYLHNKPTLAESKTIWKMTADAFAVSTDGGKTWNAGMDSSGNAVVNVLSAIGINFDWASGGTLSLGGKNNGNGLCYLYDSNGNKIATLDSNGLAVLKGTITGSSITLGGNGNTNGYLRLLNASGTEIAKMNSDGLQMLKGIIKLGTLFSVDASGNVISNSFKSSNAEITGGHINITSDSSSDNTIALSIPVAKAYFYGMGMEVEGKGDLSGDYCGLTLGMLITKDSSGRFEVSGGDMYASGSKSRVVDTDNFGEVLQYCYETPTPMFGDVGTGQTDKSGKCYIYFEPVFQETVSADYTYCVFIQKEGKGDIWISEKTADYFLVEGTPNLAFSWEAKVKQRGYEYRRLDPLDRSQDEQDTDYEVLAAVYLANYEKEILDYEETD
nr:MAG TPA: BNR/Asp-box repeat protein [Caudoviricetes sp.]